MSATGSVPAGTRVGRYEIVSLLRRGGMGEVYIAHDSTLGRRVALKILPGDRTSDPVRVARFVREAQASSALNHPAIVSVHDAGWEGGVHFLAMELIDGEPLSEWIRTRRGNLRRGIELMAQVADGLDRAHAEGIVHRDLKPENIVVSRDGYPKIVDFGVAKLTERLDGRPGDAGLTTPTSRIGTTAYMSPEQVEGMTVDHRTDVFAFGIVLYELITGVNPFASTQYADTLHNIVHLDPSLEGVPPVLRPIVRRCLRKEPGHRYQSIRDAALDLREAVPEVSVTGRRPRRLWSAVAALVVAIAAVAAWQVVRRTPAASPAAEAQRAQSSRAASEMQMIRLTNSGNIATAAVSPDGKYLVYAADEGNMHALYVKQIATGSVTRIADPAPVSYHNLFVSPDGDYVYYTWSTRSDTAVAHIDQMPLLGGVPRRIASDTEFAVTLSPDGSKVAFVRFNVVAGVYRLTVAPVDGSGEEVLVERKLPDFVGAPLWSAGGDGILFGGGTRGRRESFGLYEYSMIDGRVSRVPTPGTRDGLGIRSPAVLPDGSGYLVAVLSREQPPQVWFMPHDGKSGRKITSDISGYRAMTPTADSGSFVVVQDSLDSNIFTMKLERRGGGGTGGPYRPGTLHPITRGVGNTVGVAVGGVRWLSTNELLFTGSDKGMATFFVVDTGGGAQRRLMHGIQGWMPSVSRDGRRIAFLSDKSGTPQVWIMDSTGENVRQLTSGPDADAPTIAPDGQSVAYLSEGSYVWRIAADGTGQQEQLTNWPANRPSISPDGTWLLCVLRSKEKEPNAPLWRPALVPLGSPGAVRSFDVPRSVPRTTTGASRSLLQWHPSGNSFCFIDSTDGVTNIWEQPIDGGEPRQVTFFEDGDIFAFDISHDGTRLALSRGKPASDAVLIRNFR